MLSDNIIAKPSFFILPQLLFFLLLTFAPPLAAQNPGSGQTSEATVQLSLNEALEIALVNNYKLQRSRLDIREVDHQIKEARGTIYPQIGGATSFTRNVKTPNPFAGSSAEDFFTSFAAIDWLFYNEQQRFEPGGGDPLTLSDFIDRQQQGRDAAGITISPGSNPFAVENQFVLAVSATQALYNAAAMAAIRGAEELRKVFQDQLEVETQQIVNEVRTAYLRAALLKEQVRVLESSLEQLRATRQEVSAMVDQGLLSRFDRNSLDVEIVNLETMLITAKDGAVLSVRALNLTIGLPMEIDIRLSQTLNDFEPRLPEIGNYRDALEMAFASRPDLDLAQGAIRIRQIERELTRARYFPIVNAFADYAYLGNVPDNRTRVTVPDPNDPFTFAATDRSFFDSSYWNAAFSVGVRLQWSLFNGFQTRARMQQNNVNIRKAELDALLLREAVRLEVDQSLRSLESAWQRIESQKKNTRLAELNYEDAKSRLREGVGTRLEERQAATLLDQSRLNYLTAVHDYLVAMSEYEKALGIRTVSVQIQN